MLIAILSDGQKKFVDVKFKIYSFDLDLFSRLPCVVVSGCRIVVAVEASAMMENKTNPSIKIFLCYNNMSMEVLGICVAVGADESITTKINKKKSLYITYNQSIIR